MAMAMMSWMLAIPALGFFTGCRTMMPMAVLCWFAYFHHLPVHGSWGFWAASPITALVFTVLAAGELVGDKLPQTPSRMDAFPLIARILFGSMVGALAATGLHGNLIEGILLGALSALAGAFIGFHIRSGLKAQFGWPDLPIALTEDVLVIGGSILAMGIVTG